MLNKSVKIALWAVGMTAFVVTLIVLGVKNGIYDYQFNVVMHNPDSLIANIFAYLGDGIAYVAIAFGLTVVLYNIPKEKAWAGIIVICLLFVDMFVMNKWFVEEMFVSDIVNDSALKWVIIAIFAGVETFVAVAFGKYVPQSAMKKLFVFGIFVLCVVITSQIITQGTKLFWCRLRFRNMNAAGDGFTAWWHPNWTKSAIAEYVVAGSPKLDDFYKSMPSGHTAAAASLFSLIFLPVIYNDAPKYKISLCYVLPFVVTIVMALMRVVSGAHFLSDTVIGGASAFFAAVIWKRALPYIITKINNKKRLEKGMEEGKL